MRSTRHHWTADGPLPREMPATVLDMHIVLVKLNNRSGIEVKIRVRTYLIYPGGNEARPSLGFGDAHVPLAALEYDRWNRTQCPCSCYDTIMFFF